MSEYKSLVEQIVDIIGTQCILSNDTAYDLANKIIDCFVYPVNEHEIAKKDLEWIPCSERLPKESERDFIVSVAKKYRWLGYSVILIRESSVLINGYKDGFYEAWQKAPKPYEVKENGTKRDKP